MRLIFKFLGIAVVMIASYMFGKSKVTSLKNRKENLQFMCVGLEGFKESVGFAQWELDFLYKKHFASCRFLRLDGNTVRLIEKDFTTEDIEIINEFFEGAGALDCGRECERIELYRNLLNKQLETAEKKFLNEEKLWKTVCLCMGLGGGIMLL